MGQFYQYLIICSYNEYYKSRFAYVDFATAEAKAAAIARSEQPLIGRRLLIKDGEYSNHKPTSGILSANLQMQATTLPVGPRYQAWTAQQVTHLNHPKHIPRPHKKSSDPRSNLPPRHSSLVISASRPQRNPSANSWRPIVP